MYTHSSAQSLQAVLIISRAIIVETVLLFCMGYRESKSGYFIYIITEIDIYFAYQSTEELSG